MWLVSISVMLAVVQCASRAGGSPRLPTFRMPPFFCASTVRTLPATSTSDATPSNTARRCGLIDMVHLRSWVSQFSTRTAASGQKGERRSEHREHAPDAAQQASQATRLRLPPSELCSRARLPVAMGTSGAVGAEIRLADELQARAREAGAENHRGLHESA